MNVNRFRFSLRGLTLCALLSPTAGFAQPANLDSLRVVADSLHTVGDSLLDAGQYSEAIAPFEQEIELRKQLTDTAGWCATLNKNSEAHWRSGDTEQGMALARKALELGIETFGEEDTLVASSYYNVGAVYYMRGSYKDALKHFEKALGIELKVLGPEHPSVATSYNNIGLVYKNLRDYERALENYEKALEIRLKALGPEHPHVATIYNNIGIVYADLGKYEQTLENFEKALAIRLKALGPEHPDVAASYNNIGNVYWNLGNYQKALGNCEKALAIFLKALGPEHPHVATSYNNIGNVYADLGDYQKALENYEKALGIRLKVLGPEHPDVAESYGNIGLVYGDLGSYEKALENREKALAIFLKVLGSEHPNVALSYNNIGTVYDDLGSYEEALENYQKALVIFLKTLGSEHPYLARSYNNIGNIYYELGNYDQALENYEKALGIFIKVLGSEHPDVAVIYGNIGNVYGNLGSYEEALEYHEKAKVIKLKVLGEEHPNVATCYNNIGNFYYSLGDYQKAFENYEKGLTIWLNALGPEHPSIGASYNNIGDVCRVQDQPDSALVYYEKSIDIFEKSRGKIESEELRGTYTETVTERYEAIISLLMEMDRPEEAFEYLERSKSKALKDALNERYDIDFGQGIIQEKLEQTRQLAVKTDVLEGQLIEEQQKPDSLRNELKVENLSKLLAETKAEYLKVAAEIRVDPDYAFAVQVHPTDIGALGKDLPDGQKLVMFYSGDNELYLFLVSNQGHEVYSVPVSRDSLDALIARCLRLCDYHNAKYLHKQGKLFGWSWTDDGSQFYQEEVVALKVVLSTLYNYLIKPVEAELASAEVVTFIPSGHLYYIPWGALLDTDADSMVFLSERYNWNIVTSTEFLKCIYRRESEGVPIHSLALVGNPTGANLPSAEEDVKEIKKIYRNSTTLVGTEATEPNVIEVASQNQVLHLATHSCLNSRSPLETYIQLAPTDSTDGRWTVAEVWGESWEDMQLVTLAACETAVGSAQPGLEFISMAKAFSLAMEGPPSIVATLWSVYGYSTTELMAAFYERLKDGDPKSEALRKAQQKLIHSDKYAHPFFWAPFILIGEWR